MENTSDPKAFPERGRLLGVDYGTKRVGFAVCDSDQRISSPIENYERRGPMADETYLKKLIEEYRPVGIVVGLPVHSNGDEGLKSGEARAYGKWLADLTKLPVTFADERFTSIQAEAFLTSMELTRKKRKKRVDMLAAHFMLQGFLEQKDRSAPPGKLSG